jgi:hypothetical protein
VVPGTADGLHMCRSMRCGVVAAVLSLIAVYVTMPASPAAAETVPALGVGDVRVMEPFNGSPDIIAPVPVVLNRPATVPVTFDWSVRGGTADAADVVLGAGTALIPAGEQATSVAVAVHGDTEWEAINEWAALEVSGVSGATVERASGRVVIRDAVFDGVPVGFVVGDVTVPEPETGSVRVAVPVTLPAPVNKYTSLTWELRSQYTAVVGEDAAAASGTLTLPQRVTSGQLYITIYGDTEPEPLETLLLKPLSAINTAIGDPWGLVRILRDDAEGVALPWTAPADVLEGPGTAAYFESSLGDWVGGGQLVYDTLATSGISITEADGQLRVFVNGDVDTSIYLTTSGDRSSPIVAGSWQVHGMQYGVPGFTASQGAASCNSVDATFVIEDLVRAQDGTLDRFVLRFEQFCDNSLDPMRGFVRYVRDDPTHPPSPLDPATYPWQPPAGAIPTTGNWLYFQSTGEWVGQGQTRLLSVDDPVNIVRWPPGGVQIDFRDPNSWWTFIAAVPTWVPRWQTGWFPATYGALANPVKAPLDFSGEGRGCNAVNGDLVVDTATHDANGNLTALSLRFKQICDGDPDPLYGAFRWSGRVPDGDLLPPTGSVTINGGAAYTVTPSVSLSLPAADALTGVSDVRISNRPETSGGVLTYGWTREWTATPQPWSLTDSAYGGSTANGTRSVYAQFRDRAGNWSPVYQDTIVLDTVAPVMAAPVAVIRSDATVGSLVPAQVTWSASDATSGVAGYQVEQSTDGGAWTRLSLSGPLVTSVGRSLSPGHSYRFRVRAIDRAGLWSGWRYGPVLGAGLHQESSTALAWSGTWSRYGVTGASGGAVRGSTQAGAKASFTASMRSVGWVAVRGPTRGKASVYVDGVLIRTVDLYASTTQPARIVFTRSLTSTATHTVTVRVVGTSGRPRVEVDALVMLR